MQFSLAIAIYSTQAGPGVEYDGLEYEIHIQIRHEGLKS